MLELPELEILRRFISAEAAGRRVESIRVADRDVLNGLSPRTLHARLAGSRLHSAWRIGPYIGVPTDGEWTLILHLSAGAEVVLGSTASPTSKEDRLELELDRGVVMRYRGGRRKGSVDVVRGTGGLEDEMGPDAFSVSAAQFDEISEARRGQLKNALVDQSFISGLGDVMADEALFRARLHPQRPWLSLSAEERRSLWQAIWTTLRDALQVNADYSRKPHWLASDRRPGRPCPHCGHGLVDLPGRRASLACVRCQPLHPEVARPRQRLGLRQEPVAVHPPESGSAGRNGSRTDRGGHPSVRRRRGQTTR